MIPFPFTAVVGLERAKRSLIFHAIDARLGGTLLLGHRGCAKTTLARAFAALLPHESGAFVEVPLGATEDRLLGSVDARHLLDEGKWRGRIGLIEQAHGGVLYIDEINLLPDQLADFILDSAATGQYRMERDGLTRQVESRYILIGSMNPDEGELRPQLSDRFAHGVRIADEFSTEERMEIVRRRIAFDDDPRAFVERFTEAEDALKTNIHAAREHLTHVVISDEQRSAVAEKARLLQLEGLRAELAVLRTARAAAALNGNNAIRAEEIEEAWALCLGHRDIAMHSPPPQAAPPPAANGGSRDSKAPVRGASAMPQLPREARTDSRRVEPAQNATDLRLIEWWQHMRQPIDFAVNRPRFASTTTGRHIAWVDSLIASVSRGWRYGLACGGWQLRFRSLRVRPEAWLFLDASRSTGAGKFLAHAKNAVVCVAQRFRATRWHVLILQNGRIEWKLRRAPFARLEKMLTDLSHAGGKSHLTVAMKTLRRAMLRRGVVSMRDKGDRVLICSDGFVSRSADESVQQTIDRFRDALRALTRLQVPVLWLHPAPARGMKAWLARVCHRLPITRMSSAE